MPVGYQPTGTSGPLIGQADVGWHGGRSSHSAGLVAQRHGQVARATQIRTLPKFEIGEAAVGLEPAGWSGRFPGLDVAFVPLRWSFEDSLLGYYKHVAPLELGSKPLENKAIDG